MKSALTKRYFSLLVVLLFVIPSVTALNVGIVKMKKENNNVPDKNIEEDLTNDYLDVDFLPRDKISIEVKNVLKKYSADELDPSLKEYLKRFNEKMLERREKFASELPGYPYVPIDVTKIAGKIDPETGELEPLFPGAKLSLEPQFFKGNYDPYSLVDPTSPHSIYTKPMSTTSSSSPQSQTRSSRAPPETDLEVSMIEWTAVNEGWGDRFEIETSGDPPVPAPGDQYGYGGFQVGKPTTIKATIRNNGPATSVSNFNVNFTVVDAYSMIPMQKNPETKVESMTGVQKQVSHTFTPPFAGIVLIQVAVDYISDTDTTNNAAGWWGMYVFIWSADLESGGTNYGWQKKADGSTVSNTDTQWTGDKGTTNYQWHVINDPANQLMEHTQTHAWYHGDSTGTHEYDDSIAGRNIDANGFNHTYLETPVIDMGNVISAQKYLGDLDENGAYFFDWPKWGILGTGELEYETNAQGAVIIDWSDILFAREFADDSAGTQFMWHGMDLWQFFSGMMAVEWEQFWQSQTTPHWNYLFSVFNVGQQAAIFVGFPFDVFVGDGSGGIQDWGGAQNWSRVRFRADFSGDGGEDTANGVPGIYLDDFVTWGWQDYTAEKLVSITEAPYPKTSGVSIIYKDSAASFPVTVKNWGKAAKIDVKATIKDADGNDVSGWPQTKRTTNIVAQDQETTLPAFSWSPDEEGDYWLTITAAVEGTNWEDDWSRSNNIVRYYLHVSPAENEEVDVLVVDDDDSSSQGGVWRIHIEDRMLDALKANDMKARVYTVEYNETGPNADVMDDYEAVVWMTGLDNEVWVHGGRDNYNKNNPDWDVTLKSGDDEDIDQIGYFLNNKGKKFWLISPGFLYDMYGGGTSIPAPADFASKYMHIDRGKPNMTERDDEGDVTTQGTPSTLEGVDDTVMDGASYATYNIEEPFGFADIGGWCTGGPTDKETTELFYQDDAHFNYNALLYKGTDFMTAFFIFDFYLISDELDRKDCVYRLFTGFGMTGGVLITPYNAQEKQKSLTPGEEISFRFTVENTGKRDDKMTLSVSVPSKYSKWTTRWLIDNVNKKDVIVPGLSKKNRIYLYVRAPDMDDPTDIQIQAGSKVKFSVKAVSENTGLENSTSVTAVILPVGNITLTAPNPTAEINVKETARFSLRVLNTTNGVDDVDVTLSFSGDGRPLSKFSVGGQATTNPEVQITLEPNEENDKVELQMTAGEHTLTGYHNLTVNVKRDDVIQDSVDLALRVKQFYQVKCTSEGDVDEGEMNFTIDPNNYTDEEVDFIKKSFIINVQNFGNGMDEVFLDYDAEKDESDDTYDWMFQIIDRDIEVPIQSVNVTYYDMTSIPNYGEEEVQFDVYIPIDVEVGNYLIDFVIESTGIEILNPLEDEDENNIVTFRFDVIKPNLQFTKFNQDNADNFEFREYFEDLPIVRDFEHDNKFYISKKYNEFDQLQIEFKVAIDNIGDSEVGIDPSNIWLNITHQDEFGFTVYDANLTPYAPSSEKLIEANNNETFSFLWDFIDQVQGTEVEYTFEVTVDPENTIYEKDETDNSDTVQLTINHEKKPKKKKTSGSPGFESVILIAAIAIVLVALFDHRRRYRR